MNSVLFVMYIVMARLCFNKGRSIWINIVLLTFGLFGLFQRMTRTPGFSFKTVVISTVVYCTHYVVYCFESSVIIMIIVFLI